MQLTAKEFDKLVIHMLADVATRRKRQCVWRIRIYPIASQTGQILRHRHESSHARMRGLAILAIHRIATIAKLLLPGGARSIVPESLLLKHQLLILNRSRVRAPNLRPIDRIIASLCADLMRPALLLRSAIVLNPSTLMAFHRALVSRKYRLIFAPRRRKPGPKGPSRELLAAIVEMKRRNPRFGRRLIAQHIAFVVGVEIDKDVVRRVLAKHGRPTRGSDGPSWLTFLGHAKDSLRSVDLFRCESLILKTHWVMVVMDRFICVWRIPSSAHRLCKSAMPCRVNFVCYVALHARAGDVSG